ncbi:hypothetical protein SASPL_150718 [Salvia splendens]|uniref:Uncharacterized protein n=1 Tax=Salvia splendens TaxID=180675 RepID=A0A8X8W790_SALSN|nr:hypothetical protein SASPL_150718 [Salvia splendens]
MGMRPQRRQRGRDGAIADGARVAELCRRSLRAERQLGIQDAAPIGLRLRFCSRTVRSSALNCFCVSSSSAERRRNPPSRRFSTAALLQNIDAPPIFTYLEGFPRPDPKYDETIHATPPERASPPRRGRPAAFRASYSTRRMASTAATNASFQLFDLEVRPEFGSSEVVEKVRVLPRKIHLHPSTDVVLNATFIRASSRSSLNIIKRTVKFLCPADIIPPFIDVDLSELDVGRRTLLVTLTFILLSSC